MNTIADSITIDVNQKEKPHFPKEGLCIGALQAPNAIFPALIDLRTVNGVCFLYDSDETKETVNNCLERIAWRMALCLPVNLCEFLVYNGGKVGANFRSLSQLHNTFFSSSQKILFDADEEEFAKTLASVYRNLAPRQYAIKGLGKNDISEMSERDMMDSRLKYSSIFVSDFSNVNQEQQKLLSKIVSATPAQSGVFVFVSLDMNSLKAEKNDYRELLNQMAILFPKNNRYFFGNTGHDAVMNKFNLTLDGADVSKEEQDKWLNMVNRHVEEASSETVDLRESVITPATLWTKKSNDGLDVPIGRISSKETMDLMLCTPGKESVAHGLVVGTSGSGKSSLLHNIIINGAWLYSPEELQFVLVDLKNVEFNIYSKLPHVRVLSGNAGRKYGASVLAYISEEVDRRENVLKNAGVSDINYYNNGSEPLPRILVIIDEFQILFTEKGHLGDMRESDITKQIHRNVLNILAKGRSSGVHLIVTPNIAGTIREIDDYLEYLSVRIVMKTKDKGRWLAMDNPARVDQLATGEGVYNDNMGVLKDNKGNDHNHFFRSAYYANPKVKRPTHQDIIKTEMIEPIREKSKEVLGKEEPYEKSICIGGGNSTLKDAEPKVDLEKCEVFVGAPITVRPGQKDVSFVLKPKRGSNMLVIGANSNYFKSLIRLTIHQIINQSSAQSKSMVCYSSNDESDTDTLGKERIEFYCDQEGLRSALETLIRHLHDRQDKQESTSDRIVFALIGLWFFKDVIKNNTEVRNNLEEILINGPEQGIHTMLHAVRNSDFHEVFEKDMIAFNSTPTISPDELKREFSIQMELKGEDRLFQNLFYSDALQEDYFANIQTREGGEIIEFSIYKN